MKKEACIACRWVAVVENGSESQQLEVAKENLGSVTDITAQVIRLVEGRPSPNIGLAYVRETQEEHEGIIDGLKAKVRYAVLCERDVDWDGEIGPWVRVITNVELKQKFMAAGLGEWLADQAIEGNPALGKIIGRLKGILRTL